MSAAIKILAPTPAATLNTFAPSILIGGVSNMLVFSSDQSATTEDEMVPLLTHLRQEDGVTPAIAAQLDPTRWIARTQDGRFRGSGIEWLAFDELLIELTLEDNGDGADPPDYTYDGDPPEAWTPLGASLASFSNVDGSSGDGRSTALTYRGEINSVPFAVSEVGGVTGGAWRSNAPVALARGANVIEIFAIDDQDNEVSDIITITRYVHPRGRGRGRHRWN
jgi:hypothetical protein